MTTVKKEEFQFLELSQEIIKAFYKVFNTLRPGFLEKVYEKALMVEFRKHSIPAESQKSIKVYYEDEEIGEYFADILVDNKIIIEIKTAEKISKKHASQVLNYLKATDIEVGLLLNFGKQAEFKRFAFANTNK